MRKLITTMLILGMVICFNVVHTNKVKAVNDPDIVKIFCQEQINSIDKLAQSTALSNLKLKRMIHETNKEYFTVVLFAQSKMETLSVMLFSTYVELVRTYNSGVVSNITIEVLDQYIEFLRTDLLKAKMFEGMIGNPNQFFKSDSQLILKQASTNLEIGYKLIDNIRTKLQELNTGG